MTTLSELAKRMAAAPAAPAKPTLTTKPAAPATPASGGIKLTGMKLAGGASAVTPVAVTPKTAPAPTVAAFDLDSIDMSDIMTVESNDFTDDSTGDTPSIFADMTPIDRPARQLPADLQPQQSAFVQLLDSVYDLHHDSEAVKSAVTKLMIDMRETPYLADLVLDNDIAIIVAKMKQILGFRKVSESKAKAKRASSKKAKVDTEMEAILTETFKDFM